MKQKKSKQDGAEGNINLSRAHQGARIAELYAQRGDRALTTAESEELERLEREAGQTFLPEVGVRTALGRPGELAVGMIERSATNPRKHFDPTALGELAENMKRYGILQPLLVRPVRRMIAVQQVAQMFCIIRTDIDKTLEWFETQEAAQAALALGVFELVAGERRHRSAQMAGFKTVPVTIRELNDAEVLEVQYIENLQRQDLTAMEEAEGFAGLIATGKYTAETLAEKLGKSRSHVFTRLRLLKMIPEVQAAVRAEEIPQTIAELLGKLPTPELQKKALKEVAAGGPIFYDGMKPIRDCMSFRAAKAYLSEKYQLDLGQARFDPEAALAEAGACSTCPKRSGNARMEFPDIKSPDICLDPDCFGRKTEAGRAIRLEAFAKKHGIEALPPEMTKKIFPYGGSFPQFGSGYVIMKCGLRLKSERGERREPIEFGEALKRPKSAAYAVLDAGGEPMKVWKETDLLKEAEEAGHEVWKPEGQSETRVGLPLGAAETPAERKARREKEEREQLIDEEAVKRAFAAVMDAAEEWPADVSTQLGKKIWGFIVQALEDTYGGAGRIAEERSYKWGDNPGEPWVGMTVRQLRAMAVGLIGGGQFGDGEDIEKSCELTGVDYKAVRDQAKLDFELAEAGKAAAAEKDTEGFATTEAGAKTAGGKKKGGGVKSERD